jgi:hypothetical protein
MTTLTIVFPGTITEISGKSDEWLYLRGAVDYLLRQIMHEHAVFK